jgi:serine/threonine protein kinase
VWVAIKILKASDIHLSQEHVLYSQLSDQNQLLNDGAAISCRPEPSSWTQFLVPLRSSFTQIGPNGTHLCFVFEAMGCSVGAFLAGHASGACSRGRSASGSTLRGLKPRQAKSVLGQMLAGLVVIHSKGLVHGDLHLGNVLFPLQNSEADTEGESGFLLPQDQEDDNIAEKVRRLDGQDLEANAPKYLIRHEPQTPYSASENYLSKPKLIDAKGQAPKTGQRFMTPISLHSPELALEDKLSQSQDIWAFGCAIFEVFTGYHLFPVNTLQVTNATQIDDLMLRFSETLGPLDLDIKTKWKHYSRYFDHQGRRNGRMPFDRQQDDTESEEREQDTVCDDDVASDEESEDEYLDSATLAEDMADYFASSGSSSERAVVRESPDTISPVLEDLFDRFKPCEMPPEEGHSVKALMRRIFQYDPKQRPQAADLQRDPWFLSLDDLPRISEPKRDCTSKEKRNRKRKRSNKGDRRRRT